MAKAEVAQPTKPDKETLINLYEGMVLIRAFEERLADLFASGKLKGTGHLYAGQEAVAVGVCSELNREDYITSTHRGHGHCIAKGVNVRAMMAELYGKATGACKGKGGSMHIADFSWGMLGANGIVAAGIPIACGAGLSVKLLHPGRVAVAFFGDGAANAGAFHESLNLAAIWKLPVVFVCENNLYAEATPVEYHLAAKNVADLAKPHRIPALIVDGQDVLKMREAAATAVAHARAGKGPFFLEAKTYRYYGHYLGDPEHRYRPREEVEAYRAKDCIKRLRNEMLEADAASEDELNALDQAAADAIDDAVSFAESSPDPLPEATFDDVYA